MGNRFDAFTIEERDIIRDGLLNEADASDPEAKPYVDRADDLIMEIEASLGWISPFLRTDWNKL